MRILMLNYEFPPLGGGAGNATYYLLKEFSKMKGLQVDLITSSLSEYHEARFSHNVKIYYVDIGKNNNPHYQSIFELLEYSWKSYCLAKKLMEDIKYDLVHCFFGIPCGYIGMKLGLPYVVSLRGSDVPFYSKRFLLFDMLLFKRTSNKIWQNAKAVVANSQGLKELAIKSSPKQDISVIYNGVNVDEFKPSDKCNDIFTIISTSRLIERKGIVYLIDAFVEFCKKYNDVQLYIIGNGNLKGQLRQRVEDTGIGDNVLFIDEVNHDKLVSYYQKSDVFVLPSFNEGMSNSLLEAMASGLAIIATDTGGTKELVNHDNGIIVEKKNTQDILNALDKLYIDRVLLDKFKKESRRKAEFMSWADVSNEYKKIYEKY